MLEKFHINHDIQRHVIRLLIDYEYLRFRDLKPNKIDTNLFSYHLKILMRAGLIAKHENGYSLSQIGFNYINDLTKGDITSSPHPTIIIMLLIQNSDGDILLQKRHTQPYINTWTLPYGNLASDDATLKAAASHIVNGTLGLDDQPLRHVGDAYLRVRSNYTLLSTTLAHIFRFNHDEIATDEDTIWVQPHKLSQYRLAPAIEEIIARSFFNDPYFFEEFDETWD